MGHEDLYHRLRRILRAGPAVITLRNGRSYKTVGLTWGQDEDGYYAELPVSNLLNREEIDLPWSCEWARIPDIAQITDAVGGDILYAGNAR